MNVFDSLDFRPIRLGAIVSFHRGKVGERDPEGRTPYVGAAARNNGLVGYVNDLPLFPGKWLAIVNNGDGGAGYCTFQPAPFFASSDVTALQPLYEEATPAALLMLASCITYQCFPKYNFGYKPNIQRLRSQEVMVPTTTDDEDNQIVDWDGLDRLGAELLHRVITDMRSAIQTSSADDQTLPDLKFEPMFITDVFDSMKASVAWYDKSKLDTAGDPLFPFVSRTKSNNGVDSFCSRQDRAPEPGKAITIGLDTQTIGYQPVPFYTSQNIQVLRHELLDEGSGLVLAALIQEQMGKFSWGGNGATLGRLKKTRIMVPVATDSNGETVVDWHSMSHYGRALRVRAERRMAPALEVV